MTKTRGFLLAAGIMLALALTISCDSGGNTSSSSVDGGYQTYEVPDGEQIYTIDKETDRVSPYTERGKVSLYGTSIDIGTIEAGGKLSSFELPLPPKYNGDGDDYSREWLSAGECVLNLLGSPNGLSNLREDDELVFVFFYYSSEGGTFDIDIAKLNVRLKLEKGWNFVYDVNDVYKVEQPSGKKWEWQIDCPNNDPDEEH